MSLFQLPDDVVSMGYKLTKPYHYEQIFKSESVAFTGTEKEFVLAGKAYEYTQLDAFSRRVV